MKTFRNLMSALAIVCAIGAAFAFTRVNSVTLGPSAKSIGDCEVYETEEGCSLTNNGETCTIITIGDQFGQTAVDPEASNCQLANDFEKP